MVMDNISSKPVIACTDLKFLQTIEQDKRMSLDSPVSSNLKGEDSVRLRLRENLAEALRSGASKESILTDERSLQLSDVHLVEEFELNGLGEDQMNCPTSDWMCDTESKLAAQGLDRQPFAAANYPSKRLKIEADVDVEDRSMPNSSRRGIVDYAKVVAFAIEAELFRNFGSVNKKYKEKARSLLFNLKDRSNPELRTKVLSGEISPGNLCGMTAEQLASKELSEWRMAKAEELAQMVVLTEADLDPRRMVKKTHKGEFSVEAAEKENLDLVPTTVKTTLVRQTSSLSEKEQVDEASAVLVRRMQPASFQQKKDSLDEVHDKGRDGDLSRRLEETNVSLDSKENHLKDISLLPEILSLDDYIKFQANGSNLDLEEASEMEISYSKGNTESGKEVVTDARPFIRASSDISDSQIYAGQLSIASAITTPENFCDDSKMPSVVQSDVLWEGSLQFTGANTVSVQTTYQSGKKTDLKDWPKVVQVEGTLRAETLGDFLRKLPMSRSRSLMIVSFHAFDESGSSALFLKEMADQYSKIERVGVANHNTDKELYLCPPEDSMWDFLCDYTDITRPDEGSIEEGALLGFVVWKQPQPLLKSSHKSSHGKKATDASRKSNESSRSSNKALNQSRLQETIAVAAPIGASPFPNVVNFSSPSSMQTSFQTLSSTISVCDGQPLVSESILAHSTPMQSVVIMTEENPHYLAAKYASNSHAIETTSNAPLTDLIDGPPGFCPPLRSLSNKDQHAGIVQPTSRGILGPKPGLESHQNVDVFDELPPGFGPRQAVNPPVYLKPQNIAQNDDDDLPEYDFETLSHAVGAPSHQPSGQGVLEAPVIRPLAPFQPPLPPGPRPILQQPISHPTMQFPPNQPSLNQGDIRGRNMSPNQVFSCVGSATAGVTNRNLDSFASANNAAVLMHPLVSSNQQSSNSIVDDDDMPEWCPRSMTGVSELPTNLPPPVLQGGVSAGSINERFSRGPVFTISSAVVGQQPPLPPNPPPPSGRPHKPPFPHESPWMPQSMLYMDFAASKQMPLGPRPNRGSR